MIGTREDTKLKMEILNRIFKLLTLNEFHINLLNIIFEEQLKNGEVAFKEILEISTNKSNIDYKKLIDVGEMVLNNSSDCEKCLLGSLLIHILRQDSKPNWENLQKILVRDFSKYIKEEDLKND